MSHLIDEEENIPVCIVYNIDGWPLFIKNVSSSTSHKKLRLYVCARIYDPINPSLNAFPKLCEQFSARFPLKGRETVSSFALWRDTNFFKVKHDLMRPILGYGEVLRFFKKSQSFDQITTLTYVLMDNFLSLFIQQTINFLNPKSKSFLLFIKTVQN